MDLKYNITCEHLNCTCFTKKYNVPIFIDDTIEKCITKYKHSKTYNCSGELIKETKQAMSYTFPTHHDLLFKINDETYRFQTKIKYDKDDKDIVTVTFRDTLPNDEILEISYYTKWTITMDQS